ncbi:MAG: ABC transporter ATP-binding protein [Thermoprotei archaeon]|nr:MAG: ABC transporter ATP-binding protein [Thermoprotei archaeon]
MPLLEVKDLRVYYYTLKGVVKAVDKVSFSVEKGETLGLAGESGCGKSTLGFSLLRLVPPPGRIVGGKILFEGMDVTAMPEDKLRREYRWKRVSMIFQGAMNALNPVKTIGDQIAEAILAHEENVTKREALERAAELLKMVGIEPRRIRSYPHELSGGMKQRVVIAMALALNPPLVIADEPTTALDVVVQAQIMNLLKRLKKEYGMSMILISHDLALIAEIADKVAIMYAGKIVEIGTAEQIYNNPKHPYTQGLIRSVPRLRGAKRLEWIPGQPPDLRNPPPGCRFAPRCPYAMDRCRREEPPMVEVEPGHWVACWLYAKR